MRVFYAIALAVMLPGCMGAGAAIQQLKPLPGESPCSYGKRQLAEAKRKVEQAEALADTICPYVEALPLGS